MAALGWAVAARPGLKWMNFKRGTEETGELFVTIFGIWREGWGQSPLLILTLDMVLGEAFASSSRLTI